MQDSELGLKRPTTPICSMLEKVLIIMGEVDLCIIPALLPTMIWVVLVDHNIFIVMVMTEVDIGIIPDNFLHIKMVD